MSTYNENDTCLKLIDLYFFSVICVCFLVLVYEFVNVTEHRKKQQKKNSTFSFTHMPRAGLTKLIPGKPILASTPKLIMRFCHNHTRSKTMN